MIVKPLENNEKCSLPEFAGGHTDSVLSTECFRDLPRISIHFPNEKSLGNSWKSPKNVVTRFPLIATIFRSFAAVFQAVSRRGKCSTTVVLRNYSDGFPVGASSLMTTPPPMTILFLIYENNIIMCARTDQDYGGAYLNS